MTAEVAAPAAASPAALDQIVQQLKELGYKYIETKDFTSAQLTFRKILELGSKDINARYVYAQLSEDGSHRKTAEARDLMLSILDEHPDIFNNPTEANLQLIRGTAVRCRDVGPVPKAIELFRKLAQASNLASDYALLSEILTHGNFLEESIASLEKAITLDPAKYDTPANQETLKIARTRLDQPDSNADHRKKVGRYPDTKDFVGDFQKLVRDHIAVNLNSEPKFLNKQAKFFTMGSCFARHVGVSLTRHGYECHHLEIAEHVNTTYANRAFVDWLSNAEVDEAIRDRFLELLPPAWSKEATLQVIRNCDVFILTLGVAPAFFDKTTGDFVLPRKSNLNSRALAEKYVFRTTTVQENVDNVRYLIDFIRSISPGVKIVVTVSPVPLMASFEYESAVQADCLSKSTMRLAAHEVVYNSNIPNILYWPSFEIFRWAGSNAGDYYGADDGAAYHCSQQKVDGTIKAFVDMFSAA